MARLGAVPCSGSTSGRVKKRGKGHQLPSQAKYVIMSVRKFFEKEREKQKSILHDQIVKRTSAASVWSRYSHTCTDLQGI